LDRCAGGALESGIDFISPFAHHTTGITKIIALAK